MTDTIVTLVFGIICLLIGFISCKFRDTINRELREDRHNLECIKCYRVGLNQGLEYNLYELYSKKKIKSHKEIKQHGTK